MKQFENLLITISEECAEIQQATSKALRFGLENHHPKSNITNAKQIMNEYYQLSALIMHLQDYDILPTLSDSEIEEIMQSKIKNVAKWQEVSFREGTLETEKEILGKLSFIGGNLCI